MTVPRAELERLARESGADLFGVADASGFLDPRYQGGDPHLSMPSLRSVIVVGVAMPTGCMAALPNGRAEYTNTQMAATVALRSISFKLAHGIERSGGLASIAPAEGSEFGYWYADKSTLRATFSIRYAAFLAGLGRYGRNHLLLTDEFGPRVRLMAILTDLDLGGSSRSGDYLDERCENCGICVSACPPRAFNEDGGIDRFKCGNYMFGDLGGLRCGMCMKSCPL